VGLNQAIENTDPSLLRDEKSRQKSLFGIAVIWKPSSRIKPISKSKQKKIFQKLIRLSREIKKRGETHD